MASASPGFFVLEDAMESPLQHRVCSRGMQGTLVASERFIKWAEFH